jgi:hypothetical protein
MVVVNMEMPTKCSQCGFCINQKTNDYGSFGECSLQDRKTVDCLVWSRDSGCPLTEIVTCKDCKHWKDSDGVYRRGIGAESKCSINTKEVYDGNFYCALGERRE